MYYILLPTKTRKSYLFSKNRDIKYPNIYLLFYTKYKSFILYIIQYIIYIVPIYYTFFFMIIIIIQTRITVLE